MDKKKLVFVCNTDWFFLSHRLPLALEAIKKGFDVFLIAPNLGSKKTIKDYGITFIEITLKRDHSSIISEFKLILQLYKIYKKINPTIIHHITIKPCIYGSIAVLFLKYKPKIINAVTGLGYLFIESNKNILKKILTLFMKWVYSLNKNIYFIFQNNDDLLFFKKNILHPTHFCTIIAGSGVDEHVFIYTPPPTHKKIVILFASRIIIDKGVMELIQAALILKDKYLNQIEFKFFGRIDTCNPNNISLAEINKFKIENYISFYAPTNNIKDEIKQADIICLPSFYREGLPKILVEAMAIGRPIITTDNTGCNDCVENNINGFLVPIKNSQELANKIEVLINEKDLRESMGIEGRKFFEKKFTLKMVVQKHIEIYNKIQISK